MNQKSREIQRTQQNLIFFTVCTADFCEFKNAINLILTPRPVLEGGGRKSQKPPNVSTLEKDIEMLQESKDSTFCSA